MVNPIYQQGEELLLNQFGSKYLGVAAHTNVNSNEFIVQEDAVISVLTGGDSSTAANNVDYKVSMSLSDVTLKQGALIVAPQGESFQSMTIDSGTIMAYNSVVGGTKDSAAPLLLDLYPDAAAAYSLRKLRNDYTGPAIEARKTVEGDTSIQDIGFVDGELDTVLLLTFADGGDVFVAKWYDQSGGGNDAVNMAASTQPSIVVSGVINLFNNKPSIYANGNSLLYTNVFKYDDNNGQISTFGAVNLSTSGIVVDGDNSPRVFRGLQVTATTIRILSFYETGSFDFDETPYTYGTNAVFSSIRKIGLIEIWNNSLSNGNTPISLAYQQSPSYISLFQRANANKITGFIPEIVIYPLDQSANRTDIEANINTHYTIY
jgi:hypothetical protein